MLPRPPRATDRDAESELPSLGLRRRRVRRKAGLGFGSTWFSLIVSRWAATGVESGKFAGRRSHGSIEGTQCSAAVFGRTLLSALLGHNLSDVTDKQIPWYGSRRRGATRCHADD